MRQRFVELRWPSMWLFAFVFVAAAMIAGTIRDQAQGQTVTPLDSCAERSSTYQDGILVYQCEIVERDGQYFVVESNQSGIVTERPASAAEIAEFLQVESERACLADQRAAIAALATPAMDSTLQVVAERVALIEDAIRICIQ